MLRRLNTVTGLLFLLLVSAPMSAMAGASAPAKAFHALDELTLVHLADEEEIHINFSVPVNYLRHFPEKRSNILRITVDIKDPCDAANVVTPQYRQGVASKSVPEFDLVFPETTGGLGGGVCAKDNAKNIETSKTLLVKFTQQTNYRIRMGDDGRSVIIVVPALTGIKRDTAPTTASASEPDSDVKAPAEIQVLGRAALGKGDGVKAIEMFNRQLNLPSNDYTQEAQELIGQARELAGQPDMAKAEYKLYLKLYPKGEGAKRVQERLTALEKTGESGSAQLQKQDPNKAQAKGQKEKNAKSETTVTGGISQYYYGGKSWTNNHDGNGDVYNLDQSSLITSADITGRFRSGDTDSKMVFRDIDTHNFPGGKRFVDRNSVSAAYVEQNSNKNGYFIRLGRQPGTSEGVLGRFDGVSGRYNISPEWKLFGVLGQPDNGTHNHVSTNRTFFGGAVEFAPKESRVSGNVYFNQQVADGLVERRALGTELRYFNNTFSAFGLMEYDTLYSTVNMVLLQGNYLTENGINLNLFLDHRKSPLMTADVDLQLITGASRVRDLRSVLSSDQIYDTAPDLSPTTTSAVLSAFKQISTRWQVGGDIRTNRTSSTLGSTIGTNPIPPQEASGNSYGVDVNLVGSNLIFASDTNVINAGYSDDPHSTSENVSFSNIAIFRDKYKVDSSLRLSHSKSDTGASSKRYNPQVTIGYSPKPNMNFEAQFGFENSFSSQSANGTTPASKSDTFREYMFVGYRWDTM